jgi:hypothetical protein
MKMDEDVMERRGRINKKDRRKQLDIHSLIILFHLEPFYNVVEGQDGGQDPGAIYNVLDEPEEAGNSKTRDIPGRTGHEDSERVYSTLEDEDAPENCSREVPGRTGNDERVYSVLEDEKDEPDYLTILPDKSDYEQPIHAAVPDA